MSLYRHLYLTSQFSRSIWIKLQGAGSECVNIYGCTVFRGCSLPGATTTMIIIITFTLSHTLALRSVNVKFEPTHEHNRKTRDGALSHTCFVLPGAYLESRLIDFSNDSPDTKMSVAICSSGNFASIITTRKFIHAGIELAAQRERQNGDAQIE